jgi:hypothetical protein
MLTAIGHCLYAVIHHLHHELVTGGSGVAFVEQGIHAGLQSAVGLALDRVHCLAHRTQNAGIAGNVLQQGHAVAQALACADDAVSHG